MTRLARLARLAATTLAAMLPILLACAARAAAAATVNVDSLEKLQAAIDKARAGDRIVLADGKYAAKQPVAISMAGTEEKPIEIEAKTVGGAQITGDANFRFDKGAAYVVLKGFVFTNSASDNGGAMLLEAGAHHCRVTRNVFALKVTGRSTFFTVNGDDNEIDHNTFRDKNTEGQMLFVQGTGPGPGDAPALMAKRNWVHHNFFLNFGKGAPNNASGLHFGSSHRSMDPGYSLAEYNLFVKNVGENEGAICSKTTDAIYRYNTIVDSTELSLRHGHRAQVYGNFFLRSDGVRFFAHDHEIFSNYFEGCRIAIAIGNGDATIPPGKLTAHQRPDRVKVVYNTLVNNRSNVQMGGRNNGLGAEDLIFADNLIVGGNKAVTIAGPLRNAKWEGNIIWNTEGGPGNLPSEGYTQADPRLVKDERGVYHLSKDSPAIGKGVGAYPFVKEDIDAQPRPAEKLDVGADQFSTEPGRNRPLTPDDVGPNAPEEHDRPVLAAPKVQWIAAP
jgi:poly(beta-D-mannuronate) lyase